ncbi:FapA family protein [candidate division KSB1 bacterium]
MEDETPQESRDGKILVKLLNNGLEAAIVVYDSLGEGKPPTVDMAKKLLRKEGVVYGIDDTLLNAVFDNKEFEQEIVVARGLPAIDGKDSEVKYFFDVRNIAKPKEDDKGNVDFKDLNLLQNVTKGTKLAEMIPPVPGKEGKTVNGKRVLPVVGKTRKLPIGINTEISPENKNIVIAATDGNVFLKGGSLVQVDPIFVVNTDVDYRTGNIDYVGALVIKGSVKAGFMIKAQSELEIQGIVEDAEVFCGSNVMIKGGFLGKGDGKIVADGSVILKFCENQTIESKDEIVIGEHALNCTLKSESKIQVAGKKGVIVGGYISAKEGLEVNELGNYQEQRTEVVIGIDEELIKKLKEAEEAIVKADGNVSNVKKAIYMLLKKKVEKKGLPQEQANLLEKLQKLQQVLPAQKNTLEENKAKIEEEMKKYETAEVKVLFKVYPGVRIQITKYRKVINEEIGPVSFRVEGGEIQTFRG